jgi:small basic protein (TIGR04137 family)
MPPIEKLEGRAVADAELIVRAADLGVFVSHPLVRRDAVIVALLDHEGPRDHQIDQFRVAKRFVLDARSPSSYTTWFTNYKPKQAVETEETFDMTMDKSLQIRAGLVRSRSVLSRGERIARLQSSDRWVEGQSPLGLPKVRVYKISMKKKKKRKEEEGEAAAAEGAAAPAAPAKK